MTRSPDNSVPNLDPIFSSQMKATHWAKCRPNTSHICIFSTWLMYTLLTDPFGIFLTYLASGPLKKNLLGVDSRLDSQLIPPQLNCEQYVYLKPRLSALIPLFPPVYPISYYPFYCPSDIFNQTWLPGLRRLHTK